MTSTAEAKSFEDIDMDIRRETANFIFEGKSHEDFAKHQWLLRTLLGELLYTTNISALIYKGIAKTLSDWEPQPAFKSLRDSDLLIKTMTNMNDSTFKRLDQMANLFKQIITNEVKGVRISFTPNMTPEEADEITKIISKSPIINMKLKIGKTMDPPSSEQEMKPTIVPQSVPEEKDYEDTKLEELEQQIVDEHPEWTVVSEKKKLKKK